jgi:lysophospholipase L1-like esterase
LQTETGPEAGAAARPWPWNVLIAVVAALLTLAAVEAYYRATYEEGWYTPPDFPPGRFPRLNADGLRDVDYGPKQGGTYRILLLGDSFTFGSGVEDDEAIWPALVEKALAERRPLPAVTRWEVLNAGIAGSLTHQWVEAYAYLGERFRPDLVVAVFFLRDGTQLERGTAAIVAAERARIAADPLARVSVAYRYLLERRAAIDIGGKLERFFVDSYVGAPAETAEWERAQHNLLALREMASAAGARFGIAVFPVLYGLEREPYPFQPAMDALERFCAARGIPHVSLLPAFRHRHAPDLWVSDANQHPNAEGHRLAADAMLAFILRLIESPTT